MEASSSVAATSTSLNVSVLAVNQRRWYRHTRQRTAMSRDRDVLRGRKQTQPKLLSVNNLIEFIQFHYSKSRIIKKPQPAAQPQALNMVCLENQCSKRVARLSQQAQHPLPQSKSQFVTRLSLGVGGPAHERCMNVLGRKSGKPSNLQDPRPSPRIS